MKRGNGEGSIYYDKSRDRWIAQYICGVRDDGKVIRKSVSAKTKPEIIKKLNEVMYKANNLSYTESNNITLDELISIAIEEKFQANVISEVSYARLKCIQNKIKNSNIGKIPIQKLTSYNIQIFLNGITNLSNSSINKIFEMLKSACNRAIKKKIILENPMDEVIKPNSRVQTKDIRALTMEEQSKFTEYLKMVSVSEEKYKVCFLLEMYMGLRVGEALALQKQDIDLKNGYIKINKTLTKDKDANIKLNDSPKTFAGRRRIPIPDIIKKELKEQVEKSNNNKDNLLFLCDNDLVRPNSLNSVIKRIFKSQLGLDNTGITTHVLRHTYATRCIEAGMSAVVLQRLMGHTDIKITLNTYTSVFNDYKESELNKVAKYLNKNLKKNTLEMEI